MDINIRNTTKEYEKKKNIRECIDEIGINNKFDIPPIFQWVGGIFINKLK